MKQYFAKYFPVEGEIKEGDPYIAPKISDEIFIADKKVTESEKNLPNIRKKVKLFLCSREEVLCSRELNNEHLPKDIHCKLIGEISPEATWVKDGDEFYREDLFGQGFGHAWTDEHPPKSFKIKGPCGHFH